MNGERVPAIAVLSLSTLACILLFAAGFSDACVYLSEVCPNPQDDAKNEWIELHNNCTNDVNLTGFLIGDPQKNYSLSGTLLGWGFVVAANSESLFTEKWNASGLLVGLDGVNNWMNNDGDNITLYNGSARMDNLSYTGVSKNQCWIRCAGAWLKTANATPGYSNDCPGDAVPASNETVGNETAENATTAEYDYSGISLDVCGPEEPVRFGDLAQIKAVLHTGGHAVPLRLVTYLYSPHWASIDMEGEAIHYSLNEAKAALDIDTPEDGKDVILHLPLLVRNNCDGDYESGIYTGKVKIYKRGTNRTVGEETFSVTLDGNNPVFCPEKCKKCKECECVKASCSSGAAVAPAAQGKNGSTSIPKEGATKYFSVDDVAAAVPAGGMISTNVTIRNAFGTETAFTVYSYAYDGNMCLSLGKAPAGWMKGWDANKQAVTVESGGTAGIELLNMIPADVTPGSYSYRVRLKYGDEKEDATFSLMVTAPQKAPGGSEVPDANKSAGASQDNGKKAGANKTASGNANNYSGGTKGGAPTTGMTAAQKGGNGQKDVLSALYEAIASFFSFFKF